ncbi:hypothetical protein GGR57DRAFT_2564 [Xylariaceae sp. FL1272]|nr:hypothetical protein GGR57DRAFT_2564 [Xylariaceae sp. FL1272]
MAAIHHPSPTSRAPPPPSLLLHNPVHNPEPHQPPSHTDTASTAATAAAVTPVPTTPNSVSFAATSLPRNSIVAPAAAPAAGSKPPRYGIISSACHSDGPTVALFPQTPSLSRALLFPIPPGHCPPPLRSPHQLTGAAQFSSASEACRIVRHSRRRL